MNVHGVHERSGGAQSVSRSSRMEPACVVRREGGAAHADGWGGQRGCLNVPYSDTYIPVQPNLPPPNQPHKSEREHNNVSESASTSNKEEKKAVNCV